MIDSCLGEMAVGRKLADKFDVVPYEVSAARCYDCYADGCGGDCSCECHTYTVTRYAIVRKSNGERLETGFQCKPNLDEWLADKTVKKVKENWARWKKDLLKQLADMEKKEKEQLAFVRSLRKCV